MNDDSSCGRPRWLPKQLWAAIGLVFIVQVGLIFGLSERSPITPRKPPATSVFHVANPASDELRSLEDPTLFVLPHREGFSGKAWMMLPRQEFHPETLRESERWLSLVTEESGIEFSLFARTNARPAFQTLAMIEPTLAVPQPFAAAPNATRSAFHFDGDLANRRLLSERIELAPRPSTDLLTNSVVQLWVDAQGFPFSAILLPPRSGSKETSQYEADQYALQLALSARFEPLPAGPGRVKTTSELTSGTMVFEWLTLPMTNEPAAAPPP